MEKVFYSSVTNDNNWAIFILLSSSIPEALCFISSYDILVDISHLDLY